MPPAMQSAKNSLQFFSVVYKWKELFREVVAENAAFRRGEKSSVMSDAKVSGVVHLIEETKTYGQKGFRKRLVVLEQEKGSFTNYVPVEFIRDSCDSVDDLNVGDEVEVSYRLSGRRWQRDEQSEVKYFLSAEALSFRLLDSSQETMTERVTDANAALDEAGDEEAPF